MAQSVPYDPPAWSVAWLPLPTSITSVFLKQRLVVIGWAALGRTKELIWRRIDLEVLNLQLQLLSPLLIFNLLSPESLLEHLLLSIELLTLLLHDEPLHLVDPEVLALQVLLEVDLFDVLGQVRAQVHAEINLGRAISQIWKIPALEPENLRFLNYAAKIQIGWELRKFTRILIAIWKACLGIWWRGRAAQCLMVEYVVGGGELVVDLVCGWVLSRVLGIAGVHWRRLL